MGWVGGSVFIDESREKKKSESRFNSSFSSPVRWQQQLLPWRARGCVCVLFRISVQQLLRTTASSVGVSFFFCIFVDVMGKKIRGRRGVRLRPEDEGAEGGGRGG